MTRSFLKPIALACLATKGLHAASVPDQGQRVTLRHNANLSTGGTATDVTDDVHLAVAERAVAAAQMVGLDICGVDMVCNSIHHPLEESGGGVVDAPANASSSETRARNDASVDLARTRPELSICAATISKP